MTKQVTKENVNELIKEWHESNTKQELHEFLGLTWEQYAYWVKTDKLPTNN